MDKCPCGNEATSLIIKAVLRKQGDQVVETYIGHQEWQPVCDNCWNAIKITDEGAYKQAQIGKKMMELFIQSMEAAEEDDLEEVFKTMMDADLLVEDHNNEMNKINKQLEQLHKK